ncbi:pyridoxal phosphate-dependent aminotransferase [Kamptonema animale CS-326]|jgi:aspartate/methionine/tyrosine aminotransferase|uniref:pyridoxal phosphate-dependent aminotransferase n=1 Tax=Kamptonema animale TaxID=92934 RepID=UPI00232DCE27|nr:pyridoxal phosphate-dependent aminotransferase [Kamptonema animale]MDB9511645.1 pyridoxal phosphate-dependent aminotransferase [Kamptonema animale CS-326]
MQTNSTRMDAVQSPIIPVVGEMIRQCPGTISLGQGVVYYGPPKSAFDRIPEFLADPENHKYKAIQGIPPLLEAIETKLKADNGIEINSKNCIVVTAGSNMGFMNAILAITSPGDEIIIQSPYYFNHEMAVMMADCHPIVVATDENYQLQVSAIAQAITNKTRAIVTISPNNPTGAVYPLEALREVNEICRQHGIYHISDEAYEYFTYSDAKHFSPAAFPASSEHTISLFTLSKAYGFASWRIGYMVIPEHLLVSVKKIQDTIVICPPVISQYAALGALQAGRNYWENQIGAIASVREIVLNELNHLQDFCTIPPANGAFYFLLKVHTQQSAIELVERLIREHKVAVLPGTAFGMNDGCYLRVAYGLEKEIATTGIKRLVQGLKTILSV